MEIENHVQRYQLIWNYLNYNKNTIAAFEALVRCTGEICEKCFIVGKQEDYVKLSEKRKIPNFCEFVSIDMQDRDQVIWDCLKNNPIDSIVLDSNIFASKGCIEKLINLAYSGNTIFVTVPVEVKIESELGAEELSRLSLHGVKNVKKIVEYRDRHCFCLKANTILKLQNKREEIFSELPEIVRMMGGRIAQESNTIVGNVCGGQNNVEIVQQMHLLKKMKLHNGKKNILYFLLADFQEDAWNNMGGTQLHVKDLVSGLRDQYNIVVVARDNEYLRVTEYVDDDKLMFKYYIGPVPEYSIFYDPECAMLYRMILTAFCIDIVHIHHTLWMTLDIFTEAEKLNIPIVFTMHDYYAVCPILTMVNSDGIVCTERVMHSECAECLLKQKNISKDIDYITLWREEAQCALRKCAKIIVPSDSVRATIETYYPSLVEKVEVINHGIEVSENQKREHANIQKEKVLRVAFIGNLGRQKGSELIYDIIINGDEEKFQWYLIGGIADKKLYRLKQKNVVKHGWYRQNELGSLLKEYKIDLVCILSLVPETYSYTFSEAMASGIPLVVTDIGALGERMRQYNAGWLVSYRTNAREILCLLEKIYEKPDEYMQKLAILKSIEHVNLETMLNNYKRVYDEYPNEKREDICEWGKFMQGYVKKKELQNNELRPDEDELETVVQKEADEAKKADVFQWSKVWEKTKVSGRKCMEKFFGHF
ncbi:MAG: glycosyltransferase [Eubacteriales bacterium]|nr:glycosyltransferase [Eubacteriales bacterium]